jgi:hemoglobin
MDSPSRRAAISARIAESTGIDEAMIERLVRAFYARVRDDALLGPVFETRIADWEPHLARMFSFWSSVALMTGRYHGQPMARHLGLPVDGRHFDRWLELFRRTAGDVCPPAAAAHFIACADRIAESLELGIAGHLGHFLERGQRLRRPDAELMLPEVENQP